MKFQGAVIKEQGVRFALVVVKGHVVQNRNEADKAILAFRPVFDAIPIILMAQDSNGTPASGNSVTERPMTNRDKPGKADMAQPRYKPTMKPVTTIETSAKRCK